MKVSRRPSQSYTVKSIKNKTKQKNEKLTWWRGCWRHWTGYRVKSLSSLLGFEDSPILGFLPSSGLEISPILTLESYTHTHLSHTHTLSLSRSLCLSLSVCLSVCLSLSLSLSLTHTHTHTHTQETLCKACLHTVPCGFLPAQTEAATFQCLSQ
jgi:hypothetical protein